MSRKTVHFICDADQPHFMIACYSDWRRPILSKPIKNQIYPFRFDDSLFATRNEKRVTCCICKQWIKSYNEMAKGNEDFDYDNSEEYQWLEDEIMFFDEKLFESGQDIFDSDFFSLEDEYEKELKLFPN